MVSRACALDPAERYATARELGLVLRAAGESQELPANDTLPTEPATPQPESAASAAGKAGRAHDGAFRALRLRVLALFSRVPGWVGLVWNLCLFALAVLVAAGCLFAITDPNEHDRTLPQWFLVFQYGVFLPVFVLPYLYAFCDRRWLRRRIPALGRVSVLRETAACLGIMVLAVVAYLGVIVISGVTLVSAQ